MLGRGRCSRRTRPLSRWTDTPEDIAERIAHRKAAELARAEWLLRWPVLSADNLAEASAWLEARSAELKKEILKAERKIAPL